MTVHMFDWIKNAKTLARRKDLPLTRAQIDQSDPAKVPARRCHHAPELFGPPTPLSSRIRVLLI